MISLHNVHLLDTGLRTINIAEGKITALLAADEAVQDSQSIHLHFDNCIAFPGLINSHDHLEFNLFPRLGNRIYADYTEWGRDIHATNRREIETILRIPKPLRVQWGLYKNLLNGITTVVHHGEGLSIPEAPIDVFQECNMLHSVQQEPRWKWKLNKPYAGRQPFVIHVGEGTNDSARQEIDTLIRWNLFRRRLIGVHAVAMNSQQAGSFAALVWCPDANYFLLNKTADIAHLKAATTILFGTDSTLTANWNLWEQLRLARGLGVLTDEALYHSLTEVPARVWCLPQKGSLCEGCQADIVVAKRKSAASDYAAFFALNPEDIVLVMQQGQVRVWDEAGCGPLPKGINNSTAALYSKVAVNGSVKYVAGALRDLMAAIKSHAPEVVLPVEARGIKSEAVDSGTVNPPTAI